MKSPSEESQDSSQNQGHGRGREGGEGGGSPGGHSDAVTQRLVAGRHTVSGRRCSVYVDLEPPGPELSCLQGTVAGHQCPPQIIRLGEGGNVVTVHGPHKPRTWASSPILG